MTIDDNPACNFFRFPVTIVAIKEFKVDNIVGSSILHVKKEEEENHIKIEPKNENFAPKWIPIQRRCIRTFNPV